MRRDDGVECIANRKPWVDRQQSHESLRDQASKTNLSGILLNAPGELGMPLETDKEGDP